ncbi:hypothetical protein D2E25_1824 [Bifidobacterium goeldii]|uniref:Uncharacterized protein n=1 Tax=Bifidobacterium goeldii TaxID=2306975 RepID=A0A430FF08_9BIFI|nr:hypothetical protein [Bifidobacterium goeldii]RSX51390.1 hypothetical protein D2E25_1824 [Bifidobacterium goeldii]
MKKVIARTKNLALYLGLDVETVSRFMRNGMLLKEAAERNLIHYAVDKDVLMAAIDREMQRSARGYVNVTLWFVAFAPWLLHSSVEVKRAAAGVPTWMKASDIAEIFDVSAKTLSRNAVIGPEQPHAISAVRVRRTLLCRVSDIAERYPRRDRVIKGDPRIWRDCQKINSGFTWNFRHGNES